MLFSFYHFEPGDSPVGACPELAEGNLLLACAIPAPRVDAFELTQDLELASYTREGWIWDRKTLGKGPQPARYKK